MALKVGELYSTISLDASKFNQGVAAAQKQIEGMTTKLSQMSLSWNKVDQQLARISNNMRRSGIAMSKALTAPLVAIGGVAVKAALDVDEALDIIARGTGAQGEALKGLEQEWRKLATSVTQSFEDSAKVIADYNTRLGLTGKALHDISKQALDASRMLNEDVNAIVSESAKAMQSWGVEAENMSGFLDKIFKASQDTGVGMSSLSSQLYYYGASLKAMGFDIDSSIALLAQFEREGVNTERIISAMAIGLRNMAQAGVADTNQAFIQLINTIQNAKTETEAIAIATKVFGRSGTEMAIAIREGKISVEEMADALNKADGAIQRTADSTDSFDEKIVRVRRSIMLAIEPLGTEMLNIAESVIPTLQRKSEEFATSIANMSDSSRKKIVEFAGALAVGGPLLIAISATINAVRNLSSVVMASFALPGAPWVLAAAAIAAVTYELYKFSKAQEQITGRTSAEVLDRSKYMKQAGEIFAERHGKYPITAQEYQELDKIIDELMSKERKAKIEITPIVTDPKKAPTTTDPKKAPTTTGAATDLSKLLGTGGEKATDEASKAVKAIADQVEYMGMSYETAIAALERMKVSLTPLSDAWKLATDTIKKYREELANAQQEQARLVGASTAAEIKRIEQTKQMQLEAQEAAAQGVAKFWQDVNWEYSQGLIDAQSYFDMLKGELERVTQGSEEWKRTFEDIQRVALDIVNTNIDTLSEQLEAGKITTEEFNTYVAELKGQFQDLPLVVNQIDDALKNAKSTTEDLTLQTQLWARDLSKGLADAIVYGRSLSDVLNNILRQIASSMLQKLIFGWLPFEKGGVINQGKLQPFARGGIVASPTIFPMANGMGLMGEAGPEAIMPLARDSSGKLGIKIVGSDNFVNDILKKVIDMFMQMSLFRILFRSIFGIAMPIGSTFGGGLLGGGLLLRNVFGGSNAGATAGTSMSEGVSAGSSSLLGSGLFSGIGSGGLFSGIGSGGLFSGIGSGGLFSGIGSGGLLSALFKKSDVTGDKGLYANLPRYHSGGLVDSVEQLAVLKKGEGVFTPDQMKALGGSNVNISMNINAVDANSFVQMLRHNKAAITSLVVENILNDGQIRRTIQGVT